MSKRAGPKTLHDPADLVALLDAHSTYVTDGFPKRTRLCINGIPISDNDARMIRRWRVGKIQGVTAKSAAALLQRYDLTRDKETTA